MGAIVHAPIFSSFLSLLIWIIIPYLVLTNSRHVIHAGNFVIVLMVNYNIIDRDKDRVVVVVVLGFTTLVASQVISVAFHSEREKSHKFCSEALIWAWGSFTCRKSTTRDPRQYFPSEGSHTQDFTLSKISIDPGRVWTREPRIQWHDNHGTMRSTGSKEYTVLICIKCKSNVIWVN